MKRWIGLAAFAASLLLAGCATPTKMAFQDDSQRVDEKGNPVLLMTARLQNDYHTSFQPKLIVVHVEKPDAKATADRINFTMDEKAKLNDNTWLLRMELPPGHYEIRGMTSMTRTFPIVGSFFTPLHSPVDLKEGGVYYLGQVTANVRERRGNEFRAGPPIPLIDQAAAGASGGTFEVAITDALAADEPIFRSRFPALQGVAIHKAILPPFDRAKAQAWWEAH